MFNLRRITLSLLLFVPFVSAQESHNHPAPEKLGSVSFPISCAPAVQQQFNRAVALLHSFAYPDAESAFLAIAKQDPNCAIAHWGAAMAYFHPLWEPLPPATIPLAQQQITLAQTIGTKSERERQFIDALSLIYQDAATVPYPTRAANYEHAMAKLAANNQKDVEAQVFYALALLANESPTDKTHAKQKQAVEILMPLDRAYPDHPGIAHYIIHACDNAELAQQGLPSARAYSSIAPSAPHALHMPSHIFTRLGLWDDSVTSNLASQNAARQQGATGDQLHAMDYLVYAYLQTGRYKEAALVLQELKDMPGLQSGEFKVGYAAVAMPIRYVVEQGQWADAAAIVPPTAGPPNVIAIAVWARGLGLARTNRAAEATAQIDRLHQLADQLHTVGNNIGPCRSKSWRRRSSHGRLRQKTNPSKP